jgi:hypothetical protein
MIGAVTNEYFASLTVIVGSRLNDVAMVCGTADTNWKVMTTLSAE